MAIPYDQMVNVLTLTFSFLVAAIAFFVLSLIVLFIKMCRLNKQQRKFDRIFDRAKENNHRS